MNNKPFILMYGESGVGKTTLAYFMEHHYGLKVLESYTTRPKRSENEKGHRFVTQEEFPKKDLVAYTLYNGYQYGATVKDVEEYDIFVVDVPGIEYFAKHYGPIAKRPVVVAHIIAPLDVRVRRMASRGDSEESIIERIIFDRDAFAKSRLPYTNIEIDNSEDKLGSAAYKLFDYYNTVINFERRTDYD